MGLDMYAYTINAKLVDPEYQTDAPVHRMARRAVGFLDLTNDQISKLTEDGQRDYLTKRKAADERAKNEGWFDPDFAYWRKFNALHGWMEDLYREKGGTDESFNCNTLRLDPEDIDRLESEITSLKPRAGFFWGDPDEVHPDDLESLKEFIAKSRQAYTEGKLVFYDSWW